jgi:2,3-bisphosphoglycerate-independent phosphoglycerate mutase
MPARKTIIFLGDGMADEPIDKLGGRTPLQVAHTPGMDAIARDGRNGTLFTLPAGFPTSSEVANMSVLGCDLPTEYCGRGPLEAAGRGLDLKADEYAFRMNLVTAVDGVLKDFSGGHVDPADAAELIGLMNERFGTDTVRFHTGVSYRNLMILSGPQYSAEVATEKPDDNQGERIEAHLPKARTPAGEATAALIRRLMREAPAVLAESPVNRRLAAQGRSQANGVWPWNGGRGGQMRTLRQRHNISSAVISAVDVIMGLGRTLGMDVVRVPGATGYIDTNFEGKAEAAIRAIRDHDFVYLHLEAIDEVSHEQNLELKVRTIEDFDRRIVAPVLAAVGPDVNVAVLPDHPVPLALGKHTRTPVPLAVRMAGHAPDAVQTYDELACPLGNLGALKGAELMGLLFGCTPHL